MSYRKIEVKGKTYEYTVGRTHTKIKGIGAFLNQEIGETVEVHDYCHCGCNMTLHDIYDVPTRKQTGVVTPKLLARLIESKI